MWLKIILMNSFNFTEIDTKLACYEKLSASVILVCSVDSFFL